MKDLINFHKDTDGACQDLDEPCQETQCRYHIHSDARADQIASIPRQPVTCSLKLADRGGMTLEEVGNVLGITRERVRQIEGKAVKRMDRLLRLSGYTVDMLIRR
jgi:DNA-binding CsgD family transcriptional regulator